MFLGADPEVFMQDAAEAFISAIGIVDGTKQKPAQLPLGDGFAVQQDNVAVEFNIPPADSKQQFINNIQRAMSFLSDEVAKHGCHFVNVSATDKFDQLALMHPLALEFGCDPDFNAWQRGRANPRPRATNTALRSCGGHVHVGYEFQGKQDMLRFVKYLDLLLGVPAKIMDHGKERMQLYGKMGAHRPKPYGVEYRVLSNFWIFDEKYTGWVWDATHDAINRFEANSIDIDSEEPQITEAINNNNMDAVHSLVHRYNLMVV